MVFKETYVSTSVSTGVSTGCTYVRVVFKNVSKNIFKNMCVCLKIGRRQPCSRRFFPSYIVGAWV